MSQNYFDELLKKSSIISNRSFYANKSFREHEQLASLIPDYLYLSFCVARSTVPIMEETVNSAAAFTDDPVIKPLVNYLKQHIEEERNHDQWVLDDLQALGFTKHDIIKRIPSPNIAAMIGSQYYWIKHHHPIAFMGYIGSMEVHPPTVEYVENLIKDSALPEAAFDTLMMHAKIDVAHRLDIVNLLNTLPLTLEHKSIIEMSAFQTYRYMALIMEDIIRSAPAKENEVA